MTPQVIDQAQRQKYLIIYVVSILVSFVLGYTFAGLRLPDIKEMHMPAYVEPATAPASEEKTEPAKDAAEQKDKSKETRASRDKDKTSQNKSSQNNAAKDKKQLAKTPKKPKPATVKKVVVTPVKPKPENKPSSSKPPAVAQKKTVTPAPDISASQPKPAPTLANVQTPKPVNASTSAVSKTSATTAESASAPESGTGTSAQQQTSRQYAVQVGLFASRDNASKYMNELVGGGYKAYISEFRGSDGETRFNVRFGPFSERNDATAGLENYQRQYNKPAYVIILQ